MRYRIVGNHAVDGVKPGRHIVIDDERRARILVRGGHIVPAPKRAPKREDDK